MQRMMEHHKSSLAIFASSTSYQKDMKSTTTMLRVLDIIIILLLIGLASIINCSQPAVGDDVDLSQSQTYIILTRTPEPEVSLETWYQSFLPTITTTTTTSSNQQQPQILHSYRNVVTGFAARLTLDQVKAMEDKEGFLSSLPDKTLSLQTTRTPNFLGLVNPQGLGFWDQHSKYGKGMVIGVVDSGIIPNHPSFSDEGIPPPPAKWKGKCEFKAHLCNNKLIGARNVQILTRDDPPYDDDGHGSHTAGTAAGNFVRGANIFGNAYGTAAGVAPHSHLAIYRACTEASCLFTDVLAAMDVAVEDGVDVLSLSIIDLTPTRIPFHSDLIAIGAFRATQYFGVFVSCAAANYGPHPKTLSNEAPWILTVGASTIDRTIKATARLGNGAEYHGQSLFQPRDFKAALLHLVYAGSNGNQSSALCVERSLRNVNVRGKIVVCDDGETLSVDKGKEVRSAGGAAMIVVNLESEGFTTESEPHVLPATQVSYASGLEIKAYISSTRNPKATILFGGTVIGNHPLAPAVGSFSSRGPSKASPGILKPDIVGPGVNILAAWPFSVDNSTKFNVISGTSMSCPHLSGIAALLKSCHPNWSPTAIKSAIMTTADVDNRGGKPIVDETLSPADLFAIGAGHVNPSKANDPGLVYDLQPDDYIPYLCGLKYTDKQVEIITQSKVKCSKIKSIPETQLNYPSFSVIMGPKKQRYTRTVTNVGEANSTYILELLVPQGVGMKVQPKKLAFTKVNQKATYTVEFIPQTEAPKKGNKPFGEGYLKWISVNYSVRSPISVTFARNLR